jgi:hypothetical protein
VQYNEKKALTKAGGLIAGEVRRESQKEGRGRFTKWKPGQRLVTGRVNAPTGPEALGRRTHRRERGELEERIGFGYNPYITVFILRRKRRGSRSFFLAHETVETSHFAPFYNNSVAFKNTLYIPADWGYDCPIGLTDSFPQK